MELKTQFSKTAGSVRFLLNGHDFYHYGIYPQSNFVRMASDWQPLTKNIIAEIYRDGFGSDLEDAQTKAKRKKEEIEATAKSPIEFDDADPHTGMSF